MGNKSTDNCTLSSYFTLTQPISDHSGLFYNTIIITDNINDDELWSQTVGAQIHTQSWNVQYALVSRWHVTDKWTTLMKTDSRPAWMRLIKVSTSLATERKDGDPGNSRINCHMHLESYFTFGHDEFSKHVLISIPHTLTQGQSHWENA